jgi:hypothetical protein
MRKTVAFSSLPALILPAAMLASSLAVSFTMGGCAGSQPTKVAGTDHLPDNWLTLSDSDGRVRALPEPTREYLKRVKENMAAERESDAYKFHGRYSDALVKQMSDANEAANTAYLVSSKTINGDLTPELYGNAESHDETNWHFAANANQNLRSLVDDWGRFWLADKPSSLSPYPVTTTGGQP